MMNSVEPDSGKVGDVLETRGTSLGEETVSALYLTRADVDLKATIIQQTTTSIRFKIPLAAKPGRYALMVLTKGLEVKLIEQPVKIVVETSTTE